MFFQLIEKRRSIRKFTDREIENEKIEKLIETALRSPSSRSFNPWEFVIVRDRKVLEKLSKAKPHGSSFLKNAVLGIVVLGNTGESDVWIEDTSIASIYIHLAAEALDLGSCWIQIRKRMHDETKTADMYVSEVLDIPEHMAVESIIGIGYPDEIKVPHKKESLQYEKIHMEKY